MGDEKCNSEEFDVTRPTGTICDMFCFCMEILEVQRTE